MSLKQIIAIGLSTALFCVSFCGCGTTPSSISDVTTTAVNDTADGQATSSTEQQTTLSEAISVNTTVDTTASKEPTTAATTAATTKATAQQESTTVSSSATTASTTAEKPIITGLTPLSRSEYYGYTLLQTESNGTALRAAYDRIVSGAENMEVPIDLSGLQHSLTKAEVIKVWNYYLLDYPQHFWVSGGGSLSLMNEQVTSITVNYTMTREQRDAAKPQFDAAVKEILSKISGSWSEYERELAVHDALCARLTYEQVDDYSFTSYGALVNKKAVCEGYAESFQYLMYQCGIQCLGVLGTADGGAHKWNVIRIDGQYYHLDVTWDDPVSSTPVIIHDYFNLPLSLLQRDHTIDTDDSYPLPSCTSDKANYFNVNGGRMESLDQAAVVNALKSGNGKAELYFVNHTTQQFCDWFSGCWKDIFTAAGFGGKGYSLSSSDYGAKITVK